MLLEESVRKRPHFFRAELALVLQYYELGVSSAAIEHFREVCLVFFHCSGAEGHRHSAAFIGRTASLCHVGIRFLLGAAQALGAAESLRFQRVFDWNST